MSATLSHPGLPPDLRRVDLFKLTKQHGPALGIRHATLSVLLHLLNSVMIEDLEAGAICGVWEADKTIAEKTGNSERTVRRALKSLADMEAIALTSLKGGRRFGVREPSGNRHITLLKGINLGPFIDQWVPKLLEAHKKRGQTRRSFDQLCLKAGSLWKAICALQDHVLMQRARDILPHGRPSCVTCLAKLEAIIKALPRSCPRPALKKLLARSNPDGQNDHPGRSKWPSLTITLKRTSKEVTPLLWSPHGGACWSEHPKRISSRPPLCSIASLVSVERHGLRRAASLAVFLPLSFSVSPIATIISRRTIQPVL